MGSPRARTFPFELFVKVRGCDLSRVAKTATANPTMAMPATTTHALRMLNSPCQPRPFQFTRSDVILAIERARDLAGVGAIHRFMQRSRAFLPLPRAPSQLGDAPVLEQHHTRRSKARKIQSLRIGV
jgi:hypothetical protein